MSSYLSNLLTTTTSRYNSIKRNLLSDETDGDTEDDSHITRVLRAYYTEKGRSFPPWLPPDPRAPQQIPAQMVTSTRMPMQQQRPQPTQTQSSYTQRAGGLGDLWGDSLSQQQTAPPQQDAGASLRRGRFGNAQPVVGQQPVRGGGGGIADAYEPQQARPLPSQRAGSYQRGGRQADGPPPASPGFAPGTGGGGTAQDRLKARLWGGGRSSPTPGGGSSAASSPGVSTAGSRNPYDATGGGGSYNDRGGGGGGYSGGGGGYGSGGNPYAAGDDGYGSRTPYGDSGGQRRRPMGGLPNGPRQGRI